MPRRITKALARGLAKAAAPSAIVRAWGGRLILVPKTGAEGSARTAWLFYVAGEVRAAMSQGVPVEGSCLYPILDYPDFDDDRHCDVRLLGHVGADDGRPVHAALAEEPARQQAIFEEAADAPGSTSLLGWSAA